MVAAVNLIYESIYSARMLAAILIFASFVCTPRKNYIGRIVPLFILVVTGGSCFKFVERYAGQNNWNYTAQSVLHIGWYCGLLLVFAAVAVFCYRGSLTDYLYALTCGCLFECTVFGFFRLTYDFNIFQLRINTVGSLTAEIGFSAAACILLLVLRHRQQKKRGKFVIQKSPRVSLYLIALLILVMFMRFSLQSVYEEIRESGASWIINLSLGVIPLALLTIAMGAVRIEYLNTENDVLESLLYEKERQYLISAENVDAINRKCHDIRKQLRALDFMDDCAREQTVAEINKIVTIYDSTVKTSNPALNTLLSEKLLYCNDHGIKLTNIVDGDAVGFMTPVDIYTMFGNMLDNAVEAVEKLENPEKKIISMTVESRGGLLCIQTNNYFSGELTLENGLPKTSKGDEQFHGFGVKSIRHVAEKYGGTVTVETDNDVFILLINIPQPLSEKP